MGHGAGECLVIIFMYTSLRHAIAGDVVMLSHLAMKLFYVKMDTEQMEGEADLQAMFDQTTLRSHQCSLLSFTSCLSLNLYRGDNQHGNDL